MVYLRSKCFIETRPIFFPDVQYVVISYGNFVEVHDNQHIVIWKLEEKSKIISLEKSTEEDYKFFIALENGEIKICDVLSFSVTVVMQLGLGLSKIFVQNKNIIAVERDGVFSYPNYDMNLKHFIRKRTFTAIAFSSETGILASVNDKSLYVKKLPNTKELTTIMKQWKSERSFTTIACHPTKNCIATGDTTGQAIVWLNVLNNLSQISVYHWHFLSLTSIEFNCTGTHMLTGGNEGVLIKWDLENHEKDWSKRHFPRLESAVESIRSCLDETGEYYIVTLADNSYHIITRDFTKINSYYGAMQRSLFLHKKLGKSCALNPVGIVSCHNMPGRLKYCAMTNGHEGSLQFFNTLSNEVEHRLDVTCQNWPTENENRIVPGFIQVRRAAVSHCGRYIATYEQLGVTDNKYDHMRTVRLFHWSNSEEKFTEQSVLPFDCFDAIVDIIFHPSKNEHAILVSNSSKLFLLTRRTCGEKIRWDLVQIIDLAEVLNRFNVYIAPIKIHRHATLATVVCSHNDSDGLLAIGSSNTLTLYLWSHLLTFKTQPLVSQRMDRLMKRLSMPNKTARKFVADIESLAIVGSQKEIGRYRVVCGLYVGLMVVDVEIGRDGAVAMSPASVAMGDAKSFRCSVAASPNDSAVAFKFHGDDNLTIFDAWEGTKVDFGPMPPLSHITWVKVASEEKEDRLVVAGVFRKRHIVEIATCEEPPTVEAPISVSAVVSTENMLENTVEVDTELQPKRRRIEMSLETKIRAFALHEQLNVSLAYQSLYAV